MRNFQGILFICTRTYREIFRSALMYRSSIPLLFSAAFIRNPFPQKIWRGGNVLPSKKIVNWTVHWHFSRPDLPLVIQTWWKKYIYSASFFILCVHVCQTFKSARPHFRSRKDLARKFSIALHKTSGDFWAAWVFLWRNILWRLQDSSNHLRDNLNEEASSGYLSFTGSLDLELKHQFLTRLPCFHISRKLDRSSFSMSRYFAFPYWNDFLHPLTNFLLISDQSGSCWLFGCFSHLQNTSWLLSV